ncbi:MAG: hypothetical protein ACHQJ4_02590 [Ignavibacteria bacterium]
MHRLYKKYFVSFLAVTLILSNFSFITTYSICSMGTMKESCACKNTTNDVPAGLNISKEKKSCCEEKIVELSNSNILSIDKSKTLDYLQNPGCLTADNFSIPESPLFVNNLFKPPDKIPKNGIPVTNSSLLI